MEKDEYSKKYADLIEKYLEKLPLRIVDETFDKLPNGTEKSKIKEIFNDVITEYDGKKINEPSVLRNMVANTPPEEEHKITILRDNKTLQLTVKIGELPADMQDAVVSGEYQNVMKGVSVQDITPELAKKLRISDRIKGVIISDIGEESIANGILMQGDVIQEINRKKVADIKAYQEVVSKIKAEENVLLLIFRNGSSLFITLSQK